MCAHEWIFLPTLYIFCEVERNDEEVIHKRKAFMLKAQTWNGLGENLEC